MTEIGQKSDFHFFIFIFPGEYRTVGQKVGLRRTKTNKDHWNPVQNKKGVINNIMDNLLVQTLLDESI